MSELNLDESPAEQNIEDIPTYIIPIIFSLFFCLLPGLVALAYSLGTTGAKKRMEYTRALEQSTRARQWMQLAYVFGVLMIVGAIFRYISSTIH